MSSANEATPARTRVTGVPGELFALSSGEGKPFMPPMRETFAVPLRHSDIVVDIGAYVGAYAIRCARYPVQRVTAYEPTPSTYRVLARTPLPNLITKQAAIVHDDRETVTLHIGSGLGVTNSIVKADRKRDHITVPAIKYEDAVRGASIVKIDIEGGEYTLPIVQPSLRAIILEFHPITGRDWRARAHEIMQNIRDAGFAPAMEPTFQHGWALSGAWTRELPTSGAYEPMMRGRECCGCGAPINAATRALCPRCWEEWLPKHRQGYAHAT